MDGSWLPPPRRAHLHADTTLRPRISNPRQPCGITGHCDCRDPDACEVPRATWLDRWIARLNTWHVAAPQPARCDCDHCDGSCRPKRFDRRWAAALLAGLVVWLLAIWPHWTGDSGRQAMGDLLAVWVRR